MSFADLQNLRRLFLNGNAIDHLPNNLFSSLIQLEVLSLKRNQIHTLNNDIFWNQNLLTNLDLSSNKLTRVIFICNFNMYELIITIKEFYYFRLQHHFFKI